MWATANRPKYNRDKLRYPSDLTGEEWAHIAPLIPPAKHGGRKRKVDVREVVNEIMYVLSTGCRRRERPSDGHGAARPSWLGGDVARSDIDARRGQNDGHDRVCNTH